MMGHIFEENIGANEAIVVDGISISKIQGPKALEHDPWRALFRKRVSAREKTETGLTKVTTKQATNCSSTNCN